MCEFRHVRGHIEVYIDGQFMFSADTMGEAYRELWQNYREELMSA